MAHKSKTKTKTHGAVGKLRTHISGLDTVRRSLQDEGLLNAADKVGTVIKDAEAAVVSIIKATTAKAGA